MNKILEKSISAAQEKLPEADQLRLAGFIDEFVAQSQNDDAELALQDPAYREYLEQQLELSEQDRIAGRYSPAKEVFARLRAEFAAKNNV